MADVRARPRFIILSAMLAALVQRIPLFQLIQFWGLQNLNSTRYGTKVVESTVPYFEFGFISSYFKEKFRHYPSGTYSYKQLIVRVVPNTQADYVY